MGGPRVDYEELAPTYDERYEHHDYGGIERTLRTALQSGQHVLEVGCGTGHWVAHLLDWGCDVVGLEPSGEMLRGAPGVLNGRLVQGTARSLPFDAERFDAVVAVNALHHFDDPRRFAAEARRVLAPAGLLLSIGLDPSTGTDEWYVYDYFEGTRDGDLARYPSTVAISEWWREAGFSGVTIDVAQRIDDRAPARDYLERGLAAKSSTSQLALLSDAAYEAGVDRIWRDVRQSEAGGGECVLRGDLTLYVTTGRVPRAEG